MKIVSTIIQLTIGPSKNFLSHIGTPYVSSYMAYDIWELVRTWLKVLTWSGTPTMHAKYCTDIYTEWGSRLMALDEKSTFQISSLLLSTFISNIYTQEKGYYWQNQPNTLKVKGYQEVNSNVKQLLH